MEEEDIDYLIESLEVVEAEEVGLHSLEVVVVELHFLEEVEVAVEVVAAAELDASFQQQDSIRIEPEIAAAAVADNDSVAVAFGVDAAAAESVAAVALDAAESVLVDDNDAEESVAIAFVEDVAGTVDYVVDGEVDFDAVAAAAAIGEADSQTPHEQAAAFAVDGSMLLEHPHSVCKQHAVDPAAVESAAGKNSQEQEHTAAYTVVAVAAEEWERY